jgi:hypothetical protein
LNEIKELLKGSLSVYLDMAEKISLAGSPPRRSYESARLQLLAI